MNRLTIVSVLFVIFTTTACKKEIGEGPTVTQIRSVENFNGITSHISASVVFSVAPNYSLQLTGQQNILDLLETRVVNGVLTIDFRPGIRIGSHEKIVVIVTAPSVDLFRMSGSGDMDIMGDLSMKDLELSISGSGKIQVQHANVSGKLIATLSGSGNLVVFNGAASEESLYLSGSGIIDLGGVVSRKVTVHISGSGDAKVSASESLEAHISGSGSVFYHGNPVISSHISGSGRVTDY